MTKIQRLQREALESCRSRGHTMGNFQKHDYYPNTVRISNCKVCDMQVVVNSHPMPNEIDIGGEAVALHCPTA